MECQKLLLLPETEQFSASYWTEFPLFELRQQAFLPLRAGDMLQLLLLWVVSVLAVNTLQLLLRMLAAVLA